jgi:hypothetical protein
MEAIIGMVMPVWLREKLFLKGQLTQNQNKPDEVVFSD